MLEQKTFTIIVDLLVPVMSDEHSRRTFITQALYDAPMLMQQIRYEGDSRQFAVNLVHACDEFGQIGPGHLAINALLDHLRLYVGHDTQVQIDRIVSEITKLHSKQPFGFEGSLSANGYYFISYSRYDLSFTQRLIRDLKPHVNIWVDKIGLQAGTPDWENALRDAIQMANGIIYVASPSARQSTFVRDELAVADMEKKPIYPVWAFGSDERRMDSFPMGLGFIQAVDMRDSAYDDGLAELIERLKPTSQLIGSEAEKKLHAQSAPQLPANFVPRNPYKGLAAFTEADAKDFFGRDALIGELIDALTIRKDKPRFLAVIGASGSGKSSVIMGGVIPRLRNGIIPGSENWVFLEPIVPGAQPIENLTISLADVFQNRSQTVIREDLDNPSSRGLYTLAKQAAKNTKMLLYIDQFEELFTQTASESERQHFINLITAAATESNGNMIVLLSLRADFYDRPLNYTALGALISTRFVPILPMTIADLNDVVQAPARLDDVQLTFDDGLVTQILFEVREEIGALPLLQFTLDQLFQLREQNRLTYDAYVRIGGVKGALAAHAEDTYLELSETDRELARILFLKLIEPGSQENMATRRRVSGTDLKLADEDNARAFAIVVDHFVKARLLTVSQDTVSLSHEAIIAVWKRLSDWISAELEDVRMHHRISRDATEWLEVGKRKDLLYRDQTLEDALTWSSRKYKSVTQNQRAFLNESERLHSDRVQEETLRSQEKLSFELSKSFNLSLDFDEVLNQVMDAVMQLSNAERGFIMLVSKKAELELRIARGIDFDNETQESISTIVNTVMENQEPLLTNNAVYDSRFAAQQSIIMRGLRTIICVPLLRRDVVQGAIYVDSRMRSGVFGPPELKLIAELSTTAAVAIDNARLFAEVIETHREAIETQQMMDSIFSSLATGVITTDKDMTITKINRRAAELVGVLADQAVGKPLASVLPSLRPSELATLTEAVLQNGSQFSHRIELTTLDTQKSTLVKVGFNPLRFSGDGIEGITIDLVSF